jgi:hypothetical protein
MPGLPDSEDVGVFIIGGRPSVLRRAAPRRTKLFGAVCLRPSARPSNCVLFRVASAALLQPEVGRPRSVRVIMWSNSRLAV